MSGLFVSHAYADKKLVDRFVDQILRIGMGVTDKKLFYSSGAGTGVPGGEDLGAYVRTKVSDASTVITIVTPAFARSAYCIAELGAAWATAGGLYPLLHPAMDQDDLGGVLLGVRVRSLDDPEALDELYDRVCDELNIKTNVARWSAAKQSWLAELPVLLEATDGTANGAVRTQSTLPTSAETSELYSSFVDAALYIRQEGLARTEIEAHIRSGTLIPSRYHYASDTGADNWLRLCAEPTYGFHIHTTEFWGNTVGREVLRLVLEAVGGKILDFISLGPGDGQKDADMVAEWLETGADILYYPYDISLPLTSRAVQTVRERASSVAPERLRVKAVLADFRHYGTMRKVFRDRDAPNVIALLGTLGNLDRELAFLRNLRQVMRANDVVLLEVRLASEAPELTTTSSLEHDFGPLAYYLGLPYDPDAMSVDRRYRISTIPDTETVMIQARVPLDGKARSVPLQYVHLYDPASFMKAMRDQGFSSLYEHVDAEEGFLICALQRT